MKKYVRIGVFKNMQRFPREHPLYNDWHYFDRFPEQYTVSTQNAILDLLGNTQDWFLNLTEELRIEYLDNGYLYLKDHRFKQPSKFKPKPFFGTRKPIRFQPEPHPSTLHPKSLQRMDYERRVQERQAERAQALVKQRSIEKTERLMRQAEARKRYLVKQKLEKLRTMNRDERIRRAQASSAAYQAKRDALPTYWDRYPNFKPVTVPKYGFRRVTIYPKPKTALDYLIEAAAMEEN